jgi:hypothetical protein
VATTRGVDPFLKATLLTCVLRRRGLSLHQRAPRSSPYDTGVGSHMPCKLAGTKEAKLSCVERVTAQQLQALLHLRLNQWRKGRTAMQAACNCTTGMHPFDFDASSMAAQAHTSCNWRDIYYVRKTAPPLTPMSCLLDCGTGAATRGNPAHSPTVPTKRIGHESVSRGRRRDGRYGQKWAGSNGSSSQIVCRLTSPPGAAGEPSPTREDDAPVFRPSNGSRKACPANHSSRRINSAAGQATPLAGEADDASPPP